MPSQERQHTRRRQLHSRGPLHALSSRSAFRLAVHRLRRDLSPTTGALSGIGTAARLTTDHTALNFETVLLQTSASLTLSLSNTGTASLTNLGLAITGPDTAAFHLASTCTPAGLPINGSCMARLTFSPTHPGPYAATLTITSSDPWSPTLVPLSGSGAQVPGFTLTVTGSNTAQINSGGTASFGLLLTPQGGYATPVALSCTPVDAAPNALCSLAANSMDPSAGPARGSAFIATASGILSAALAPWSWLLVPAIAWISRRSARRNLQRGIGSTLLLTMLIGAAALIGCAGGSSSTGAPYTPPGTYTYQVTASSTAGPPLTSSVTLTITVR